MRSKRSRQLSLPRFTKTNLQKVLATKSLRRAPKGKYEYENLEPRQMLNADIGLNFTTTNDGSLFTSNSLQPNISAAVGKEHIVQLTSRGFSVYDKTDGAVLDQGSIPEFFGNSSTFEADVEPRIVYDTSFDRWYAIAVDNQDLNDDQPRFQGNRVIIAASTTSDPLDAWKFGAVQFEGGFDSDGDFIPDLWLSESFRPTLTVDEFALTITAQEAGRAQVENDILFVGTSGTAIATLPKVALFGGAIEDGGPLPWGGGGLNAGTNNRFENVRGLNDAFGAEPQFVYDTTLDSSSFPLGAADNTFMLAIDGEGDFDTFPVGRQGDELILTEFSRDGVPNVTVGLAIESIDRIPIPFYREPDVVRQPGDAIRDRDSSLLNASIVQEGDFIYAAHSVRDVITDPLTGVQTEGPNAVIRWYKLDTTPAIDPVSGEPIFLVDSGVIDGESISGDDSVDLIDPSIDVSPNGTVAIGYTATGLNLFPSSYASIGVPISGVGSQIAFNDPTLLKAGEATFIDTTNHFFGRYSTTVNDPFDPNNFWTFQQYAHDSTPTVNWAIQGTQFGPFETNPSIDIDPVSSDQDIHIELVSGNLEVRIGDRFTGDLVGQYDADGIGVLTIDGTGGADRFFVHIDDLDADTLSGSWVLVGDDDDKLFVNTTADTTWQFDGDNGVNINNGRIIANGFIEFHGGTGSDRFQLPTANYDIQHDVFGNDGNDVFVVDQNVTGVLFLDGEAGDDIYNVPVTSLPPGLTIDDTAGSNDQLIAAGTEQVDSIVVSATALTVNGISIDLGAAQMAWGIETLAVDARGDDDVFNISSTTRDVFLFGQRGSDTFNIMETAVMSGAAELVLDGGEGANSLNIFQNDALAATTVVVTENLISNMTSVPVNFTATGGSFSDSANSTGISLFGSDTRGDVFEVRSVLAGDDLHVLGRDGDDSFIFENLVDGTAELIGGTGDDHFTTNVVSLFDVTIDGSDEDAVDRLDVTLTSGDDTVVVNENEYIINGVSYPATGASFTDIEDFAIHGLDGVDTFDITRTTTVASFHGGDGDDIFNVTDLTVTTGTPDINIDGGAGDNTLNVVRNESSGGDVIVNSDSIVGMTIAAINYVATGGVFGLVDLTGSAAADSFVVQTLLGSTLLRIDGQDGDDSFSVVRAPLGDIELSGNTGSDTYRVYVTGDKTRTVTILDPASQAGDDRIEVAFTNGADDILIDGGTIGLGSDSVVLDAEVEVLAVEGMDGDDNFVVSSPVNPVVELYGQVGDDTYEIQDSAAATGSQLFIFDSVNAENDALVVSGTAAADVFDINEGSVFINGNLLIPTSGDNIVGVETLLFDGKEDDDIFNINSTTRGFRVRGGDGNDTFNVTDLTATSGASTIEIDGNAGVNIMNVVRNEFTGSQVVVNDTTIEGMTIATIDYASIALVDLTGTSAADDFLVETLLPSTLLVVNAEAGNDTMLVKRTVRGNVDLNGGTGDDIHRIEVQGDKSREVRVIDPDTIAGVDRTEIVFTTGADVITVDGRNVGLGNDRVDVDPGVEVLALEGLAGDDRFNIISSSNPRLELYGQAGDDTYNIGDIGALSSEIAIFDSVNAENDTLLVQGTVNLDEFVIDENLITINGLVIANAAGDNIIGVEGITFDGREADDIFRINSSTRGFTYLGSEGNDQFFITDATATTGTLDLIIDGGEGSNEMFVSRSAIFGGAVAGTEIQIEDNRIIGMTTADIAYTATDGIFSLIELSGTTDAASGDDAFDDIFRVNTLDSSTHLRINALGGNDLVHVRALAEGDVEIDGGQGDDNFLVALGGGVDRVVTVDDSGVNEGVDRLDVFFSDADETIEVNDTTERIVYAVGNSEVDFDETLEALALHALGGDDRFIVNGTTTDQLILAGGDGDDTYELSNVFGDTFVTVIDSVNAENDRLTVGGTNDADVFEINENSFLINGVSFIIDDAVNSNITGIESLEVNGLDGDDTFIVNSATRGFALNGGAGNDHFQIHDTEPDSGADDLVIDGGTGANTMDIQRIEGTPRFVVVNETFIRNVANSTIRYSATGGSFTGGNGGITIRGLDDFNDSYLIFGLLEENSLELLGGSGNDYHRVLADVDGDVWMDGSAGRDRYVFFMDEDKSRNFRVADSGDDGAIDRINVFLSQNSDNIVLDGPEVALVNDRMTFNPTIETIEILAGDGDDRIDVRQFDGVQFLSVKGQAGNDRFEVNGANLVDNVRLIGDIGNDTFDLVSATRAGFLLANGNDGDDFIKVGNDFLRNGNLNGNEGDDRYDVSFADRGERNLVVADTGTGGNDTAIIRASDVTTQLTLRASGINSPNQLIGTTRQLESLELIGTDGADVTTMFAAPVANMSINTLTDSDIFNLRSNNGSVTLDIDLGAEPDVANIMATAVGTTTTFNLGRDDDLVNIGSSLTADDGNFDRLLGELSIDLGIGSDRIYMNDSQSAGGPGYILTDSSVRNDASVSNRGFSGLDFTGAEFLQFRGNAQFNRFTVTPSEDVRFILDGNSPNNNSLTVTGSADGRQLFSTGDFSGFWTFDAFRDVQFEQFSV